MVGIKTMKMPSCCNWDCPLVEIEERKVGKWEYGYSFPDGNYAKCTACGEIIKCTFPMHFCPNCGADMREAEE